MNFERDREWREKANSSLLWRYQGKNWSNMEEISVFSSKEFDLFMEFRSQQYPKLIIRGTKGKDHVPLYRTHKPITKNRNEKLFYIYRLT